MTSLVIGIGHTLLGDKGMGVYALHELESRPRSGGVEFLDGVVQNA